MRSGPGRAASRAPGGARRALGAVRPAALAAARRAGARARARGVRMPPAHASCLAMLEPVFTLTSRGRAIYAPDGHLLESGDVLAQPGLARRSRSSPTRAQSVYTGSIAEALLEVDGVAVTRADLESYEPPGLRPWRRRADPLLTRAAASPASRRPLARLPRLRRRPTERVLALLGRTRRGRVDGHTTNVTVVDADGCACVLTTSLGLGTGDFLPGLRPPPEQHARRGRPPPRAARRRRADGEHDGAERRRRRDGLALAIGSAAGRGCGRRSSASRRASSTRGSIRSTRWRGRASTRSPSS